MIELIGLVACLIACIGVPIQAAQIRSGKMPAKFTGTREQYVAAFRKQLTLLQWVGLGFGVVDLAMIAIQTEPGEWIVSVVGALLWLTLGGMSFFYNRAFAGAGT